MPNYPEQYFNQDTTEPQGFSNQNKAIVKEEIVSGENQNKIYVAQLVKLAGPGINVSVGSIAVDLDHTTDSIKIGDGSDLWLINPDGSGKISGSTVIYSSGGTSVNVYADGSLYISGSTRIADGSRVVSINSDNSLKISGGTVLYDSGSTRSVNVFADNSLKVSGDTRIRDINNNFVTFADVIQGALRTSGTTMIGDAVNGVVGVVKGSLRVSGTTIIGNESGVVDMVGGHLKTSGITSIQNVNVSGNSLQVLITDSESTIGAVVGKSIKPRLIVKRPNNTTQYSIGDILSNNSSTPLEFVIARSNNKSVFCVGGKATSEVSASTAPNISLLLFDSSFTIAADNNLLDLSGGTTGSMSGWVGSVKFTTWNTISSSMYSEGDVSTPFVIIPSGGTQNIYGIPIFANTYTPAADEVFSFSLEIDQN